MFFSNLMELITPSSRFSYALVLCLSGGGGQSTLKVQLIISTVKEKYR
jgi:hypothetical protein